MKPRMAFALVALILNAPFAQGDSIDKAKLRKLAELPKTSVVFTINYSTTLGFYFNGNKPDPLVGVARIRKQLKGDLSDVEGYLRLDWLYSKAGRNKEANEANAKAIALGRRQMRQHPDDMRCLAQLGEALVRSGEIKEGENLLRRAVKEAPKEWRTWLALAAYTDILALRAIGGDKYLALHALDDKILSSTLYEKKPTSEQIAEMRRLRDEARGHYTRAIELAPRETEPYFRRIGSKWAFDLIEAGLSAKKGQHPDLLTVLATPEISADMNQIARLSPDDPNRVGTALLMAILVGMQQKENSSGEHIPSFQRFLAGEERPLLDKLPGESGKAARWGMERLEQLTFVSDKATAAAASEFLANVLMVMKKFDETTSMGGMGGEGMGLMGGEMLGAPLAATEKRDMAKIDKSLRRAVQLDPSRDSAWDLLTALLVESNDTRGALEVGHNRVKIKDNAHNRFLLARICAEDNQLQEAAKHLRAALKNDPKDLDCRLALIAALLQRDDTDSLKEAGEQLNTAEPLMKEVNHKRSNESFSVLRGIHAGLSDQPKQAKESLTQALRLNKGDQTAARAISALGEPLTPDDRQLAIDYLRARKVTIGQTDKRPDAEVTEVRLFDNGITDDDLFYLTAFPQLRELSLHSKSITDAGLAHVEGHTTLEALAIGFNKITDKGLARLKSLTNLRSLDIEATRISAAGLAHLEAFQKLEQLSLPIWAISRDVNKETAWKNGLARLSKLPNLRDVSVNSASVSDKELTYLTAIPHLQGLHLPISRITDEGMALLGQCTSLRTLEISSKEITDGGMAHLKGLRHLRELRLDRTPITGAGLVYLKGLAELEVLDLSDSAITDAGLANLNVLTNLRKLDLATRLVLRSGIFEEGFGGIDKQAGKKTPAKKPAKPQITDAGLKHLRSLTKLTELDLFGRPITDAGLTQLAELKGLQKLWLGSTKVTQQGVAKFRETNPEVKTFD